MKIFLKKSFDIMIWFEMEFYKVEVVEMCEKAFI